MKPPRVLNLTRLGWALAVPVLFLCGLGLAAIHITEAPADTPNTGVAGRTPAGTPGRLDAVLAAIGERTLRQAVFLSAGLGLMFLVLVPSYRRLGEYSYWIYGLLMVLLVLLLVDRYGQRYGIDLPFIAGSRGGTVWRWIRFGPLSLQPSEFMKPALVLTLAWYLRYRKSYRTWPGLLPPFLLTLGPMVLILKQPDLGTVLMLLPVLFIMLFVAGARGRHLAAIVALGCATVPAFYFFGMRDYQRDRIRALFRQNVTDEAWHMGPGYQLRQGLTALGTGGLTGANERGSAFIRYDLVPEEHNDFIFAVIGNQWGLAGCLLVVAAYVVIVLCGLKVALLTNDPFGRLLAVGAVVMIAVQALLNICMNLGLAPITGMTLPFVSAGGSSLWANFIALGLLVNVAQRRPLLIGHPPFEHKDD